MKKVVVSCLSVVLFSLTASKTEESKNIHNFHRWFMVKSLRMFFHLENVKIHTEESQHPVLSLMNMKAMEQMLPSSRFVRVHRSYIVNKSKIREIERNRIVFGNVLVPIGDSYKQQFREWLDSRTDT